MGRECPRDDAGDDKGAAPGVDLDVWSRRSGDFCGDVRESACLCFDDGEIESCSDMCFLRIDAGGDRSRCAVGLDTAGSTPWCAAVCVVILLADIGEFKALDIAWRFCETS